MSQPLLPVDPARVLALLERAHVEGGLVATDADGTLWSGDVGDDLFDALLAAGGIRDAAREALAHEAIRFEVPAEGDANAIAAALYAAFQASRYPQENAFAMMAWAFTGWMSDEVAAFAREVIRRRGLEARFRPELRAVLAYCAERAIEVFVVSASPIAVVAAGAALVGIREEHVLAVRPAMKDGCIAPGLDGPLVYGEGKLTVLRAARADVPILAAFGDSTYDAAMLRAALVPVAVHPSKGLIELADTIPGLVVLGPSH